MTHKPTTSTQNARFLKGHASWLYCIACNKTVAYLCYVTYTYFKFSFRCSCGCEGYAENSYGIPDLGELPSGELVKSGANNRLCCAEDGSPLFSAVPKNLRSYSAEVVCKACGTYYKITEEL